MPPYVTHLTLWNKKKRQKDCFYKELGSQLLLQVPHLQPLCIFKICLCLLLHYLPVFILTICFTVKRIFPYECKQGSVLEYVGFFLQHEKEAVDSPSVEQTVGLKRFNLVFYHKLFYFQSLGALFFRVYRKAKSVSGCQYITRANSVMSLNLFLLVRELTRNLVREVAILDPMQRSDLT